MFCEKYIVIKAFNHNVVFCNCEALKNECIVIGKGVGFGNKKGDIIDKSYCIDKVFYLYDEPALKKFNQLISKVDNNIIGVVEEVIQLSISALNMKFNENLHITLIDHINFAIIRYKNNIEITNPFLDEIKFLYKDEYKVAKYALCLINNRLDICLPEDEIGFIAMHIHAALENTSLSKATITAGIISTSIAFIEESLHTTIDRESIQYARLVTHLRFAVDRITKNKEIKNLMIDTIKIKYEFSYKTSKSLSEIIKNQFGIRFPDAEIGYIAIHLENIINEIT